MVFGQKLILSPSLPPSLLRYLAVTHGRRVQVWRAPGHGLDFAPFSLLRTLPGQYDDTLCIDWSDDSRYEFSLMNVAFYC